MVSLIHSAQSYLSLFCSKGDSRILGEFVEKFVIFYFFFSAQFCFEFYLEGHRAMNYIGA
jgi:hypothetical protein